MQFLNIPGRICHRYWDSHLTLSIVDDIYHPGFHIIDDFLNRDHFSDLCNTIRELHKDSAMKPAKIGQKKHKNHNAAIRSDHILWLEKTTIHPAIKAYFSQVEMLCDTLNQTLFLGLIDFEAHFAVYNPSDFYQKHVDQFTTNQDRRISCVYYLNEDWQPTYGGELKLYDEDDQLSTTIIPTGNRFVCFNSDIAHEVCTAYHTRYSIAAWLKIRPIIGK